MEDGAVGLHGQIVLVGADLDIREDKGFATTLWLLAWAANALGSQSRHRSVIISV